VFEGEGVVQDLYVGYSVVGALDEGDGSGGEADEGKGGDYGRELEHVG
jgi:hypothetical protein